MVNQAGHGARARDAFAVDEMAPRVHELFFPRASLQIRRCAGGANTYVTADILAPRERICTELWTRRHLSGLSPETMMKRPDLFGLDGSTNCRKETVRCFLL